MKPSRCIARRSRWRRRASAGEWFNLGRVYAERDDVELARDAYRHAFELDPRDLRGALAQELSLPMVYESRGPSGHRARAHLRRGCASSHERAEALVSGLNAEQVLDGLRWTNFFLAYQGGNDRDLQASYGALAARMIQQRARRMAMRPSPARNRWPHGCA